MSGMEQLRNVFDDQLSEVDKIDNLSRYCPSCDKRGIPTPSDMRGNLIECPTPDCGVYYFRTDRGVTDRADHTETDQQEGGE